MSGTRSAFRALEVLSTFDQIEDQAEVVSRVHTTVADFGVQTVVYSGVPTQTQRLADVMIARRAPEEWLDIYARRQYMNYDPVMREIRRSFSPFEWAATRFDADREPKAREIMETRRSFGLEQGFIIPVAREAGKAFVAFSGRDPELTAANKALLHMIGVYSLERLMALRAMESDEPILTKREREVLTWIAAGKSAWEIGEILSIGKRTVDEHAQTAARKLGAVNRAQAVAIAIRDRAIVI